MSESGPYKNIICDGDNCGTITEVPYDVTEDLRRFDTKAHKSLNKQGWSFVERHYCVTCANQSK